MARQTITIKGNGIRNEGDAGGTITPGHLVERLTTTVVVHNSASGNAQTSFAIENDLVGDGIDVDYTVDNRVQYSVFGPGEQVYAILAAGESVVVGDFLESAGDGTLQLHTAEAGSGEAQDASKMIVGIATEILDLSASGVAAARLIVEIV